MKLAANMGTDIHPPSPASLAALHSAAANLGAIVEGAPRYGWKGKSVGAAVTMRGEQYWLRVHGRKLDTPEDKLWTGVVDGQALVGIAKPTLLQSFDWTDTSNHWRAEVMSLVGDHMCSMTPHLSKPLILGKGWFEALSKSLENLASHRTSRVAVRQDLVTRRIKERFGPAIDSDIGSWSIIHADLHWANLTMPKCWLLDWEAWGMGPTAMDAGMLYCLSLKRPEMARRVHRQFSKLLDTRDGQKTQLFVCAELLRMAELYGDHPDLVPHLLNHTETIVPILTM